MNYNTTKKMNKKTEKAKQKKSHTEIEQERRSKEAACYKELSTFIPIKKKLPKLAILEHISNYMQEKEKFNISNNDKSSFILDKEFNQLILEAYKGFILVVDCESGNIEYVTENIENILQYKNNDWVNHSLFEFLHRNDVSRVQNQLNCSIKNAYTSSKIQTKTGALQLNSRNDTMITNRRGFLCRMKFNNDEVDYKTVHVTGYIQTNDETLNQYFLATVRLFDGFNKTTELKNEFKFSTRHDKTGRVTFMESDFLNFLGYKTDEVLGKDIKQYCIPEDSIAINEMIEKLNDVNSEPLVLKLHFKKKTDEIITFETTAYNFLNAYNNQFEFIVAEHRLDTITPVYEPNFSELFELKQLSVVDSDTTKDLMQFLDNEIKLCHENNNDDNNDVDDIVNDNFQELFNHN